ncbi:hypothetical protein LCGC14_3146800, partial [marine sediment metagenome]
MLPLETVFVWAAIFIYSITFAFYTYALVFVSDWVYNRFVTNKRADTLIKRTYYYNNPWISKVMLQEAEDDQINDPERYSHVWLGNVWTKNDAQVFKGKYEILDFSTPAISELKYERFFYGADWGFARDPTVLI